MGISGSAPASNRATNGLSFELGSNIAAIESELARPGARRACLHQPAISTEIILGHSCGGKSLLKPLPHRTAIVSQKIAGSAAMASSSRLTILPLTPSSMISGIEPHRNASTGVPHAMASIITSPMAPANQPETTERLPRRGIVFHARIQTLMYLKLSVAGHLTILLTRRRGPFWSIRPARIVWVAVLGDANAGDAVAWFLVNDRVKLLAYLTASVRLEDRRGTHGTYCAIASAHAMWAYSHQYRIAVAASVLRTGPSKVNSNRDVPTMASEEWAKRFLRLAGYSRTPASLVARST